MRCITVIPCVVLLALLGCTTSTTTERRVPSADGPDVPDALGPTLPTARAAAATRPASSLFVCPMHPDVTGDHAVPCPKCGMTLVPLEKGLDHASH